MRVLNHQVSPRYKADKLASRAIEDRIDVYEDRVQGWILGPARALLTVPHADIAVLLLCLGYFEGWEQYRSGKDSNGRSGVFFHRGWAAVFPGIDWGGIARHPGDEAAISATLYNQLRCGAAHDGLPRKTVFIAPIDIPVAISADQVTGDIGAIMVNPRRFLEHIEHHFRGYTAQLRHPANAELRANFTKTWERVNVGSPILPEGLPFLPGPPPPAPPGTGVSASVPAAGSDSPLPGQRQPT